MIIILKNYFTLIQYLNYFLNLFLKIIIVNFIQVNLTILDFFSIIQIIIIVIIILFFVITTTIHSITITKTIIIIIAVQVK